MNSRQSSQSPVVHGPGAGTAVWNRWPPDELILVKGCQVDFWSHPFAVRARAGIERFLVLSLGLCSQLGEVSSIALCIGQVSQAHPPSVKESSPTTMLESWGI